MYMNITEFRKDLRNQFNKAITEPVLIERGGLEFELRVKPKGYPGTVDVVEVEKSERAPGLLMQPAATFSSPQDLDDRTKILPVEIPMEDGSTVISGHDIESVTKAALAIAPNMRFKNGVCKIHGLPLDSRGRCLQKGCKYA